MSVAVQCRVCSAEVTSADPDAKFCGRACFHASLRTLKPIACSECRKPFRPVESNQRFCSRPCFSAERSRLLTRRDTVACSHCGQSFEEKPSRSAAARFCSTACKNSHRTAVGVVTAACSVCGKGYRRRKSRLGSFCSRSCQLYWRVRKSGPTRPELLTENALVSLGIRFLSQHPFDRYLIDFYLPDASVALEVDGTYWHSKPQTVARDARKDAALVGSGIQPLRISDQEILKAVDLPSLIRERLDIIMQA